MKHGVSDVGSFIRQQRERSAISLRKLAERAGISNPYLSQIERGLRKPSAEILKSIARALSISAETLFERAGLLEGRDAADVESVIRADSTLSERQKQALTEIYRSFVAGTDDEENQ
jgi:transcriptional regulator with XRE-family HTH domain